MPPSHNHVTKDVGIYDGKLQKDALRKRKCDVTQMATGFGREQKKKKKKFFSDRDKM